MIRALQPGESFQDEMPVSQLYDLSRADDYYIQASRRIPTELGGQDAFPFDNRGN